jgi:hypothetical protein
MVEKAAVGRGRRREKKWEEHALLVKLQARRNELPRPQVSVCRIHKGETKRLCRRAPKNSVKKGSPFWDPSKVSVHASHETLTLHSPMAHPGSPWLRGASV